MSYRILPLFLIALALAVFVGAPALAQQEKGDKANTHEGTVVSVTATKITMKGKGADAKEHSHTLAPDARVMCDGKACKLSDLKPGQKVRVTTKAGDQTVATKIEALDKNKDFGASGGARP